MTDMDPSRFTPDRSLQAKLSRRLTQWRAARRLSANPQHAIVSFTFDDFPKSAARAGAEALHAVDAHATFYASTAMLGGRNLTGELYDEDDLIALAREGHEIGAHTHSHLDCAKAASADVRADLQFNLDRLWALIPGYEVRQFAWPYGETRFDTKSGIADLVGAARGILPGRNGAGSDLMQLRAFELSPQDWTTRRAAAAIEAAARTPAWIVIFTHDVRDAPSPFGTTPQALRTLARLARDSGAQVRTMSAALAQIEAEGAQ